MPKTDMRKLAKSMWSLSWAAGLYGAERLLDLAVPRTSPRGWVPDSLDHLTWEARRDFGDGFELAFQLGDDLQREWLERLAGWPGLGGRGIGGWWEAATEMAESSRAMLRFAAPGTEGAALRRELRNKIEVYRLVKGAAETLELPAAGAPIDLERHVAKAYALEPYPAMWALEGLGHAYAHVALHRDRAPRRLLSDIELPKSGLLMLHAGLGLALAQDALAELGPRSPKAETRAVLARFEGLCCDNARPGFEDAALEALGLVARCFFPDLVAGLDRVLQAGEEQGRLRAYFWHGVGRAIYFVPVHFLPGYGSIWHAVGMLRREAPDQRAHTDGLNGVAYAATLVNLSDPAVIESLLRHHGEALRQTSFSEGLASAVLMRRTTTPDDPALHAFLQHRPPSSEPQLVALWRELVSAPCERALGTGEAPHERSTAAGEVYRTLSAADRFEGVVRGGNQGEGGGGA